MNDLIILTLVVLAQVRPLQPWMRPFSHLGSVIENARHDPRAIRGCQKTWE